MCGMTVETPKAKTSVYRGQTYHFCSNDCREKFEAAPASYAASDTGGCG
ncbi:MAG: YHS domain-containing protein [Nitrospirota bacterium]